MTTKVAETRGCQRCCVGRNPYNGYKYLCGILPTGIFLMQWYDPLNKFMLLKVCEQLFQKFHAIFVTYSPLDKNNRGMIVVAATTLLVLLVLLLAALSNCTRNFSSYRICILGQVYDVC